MSRAIELAPNRGRSVIEIIDTEQQIVTVLPPLDEMVNEGLLTHETAEVIAYRSSSTPREAGD